MANNEYVKDLGEEFIHDHPDFLKGLSKKFIDENPNFLFSIIKKSVFMIYFNSEIFSFFI